MEEFFDIIGADGKPTGQTKSRKEVHRRGLLHWAAGVIIINDKKQILSQQRSHTKEKNPDLWDMSASGHISAGETPLKTIQRETQEEIGMRFGLKNFHLLDIFERHEIHEGGGTSS